METFGIKNLTFTYPEESAPALVDINLEIQKGEFLVICGHSGSGKSTLLRQLKSEIAPHGKREGSISFCGEPIESISERDAVSKIGFVMQNPDSQIVTDKVWHELAFGLESLGEDADTIRRRCAEMASFFGIEDWYYKNVSELSGGQKQLLCLASVMAMQPEVLILDEPTAQLDPIAASEFIGTLGKINREIGTTVIISEHRLEDAIPLSSRIAVMEKGAIICCDSAENVGLLLKNSGGEMFSAMPAAMRVWASVKSGLPCPITVNEGREFLNKYLENHPKHPFETVPENEAKGEERIRLHEVWFRYEKEAEDVLKGLELKAYSGELFCILGGNGSGKTTTLKLISGIKKAYRGDVFCGGSVGLLPQDPKTLFVKKTVFEDLKEILKQKGIIGNEAEARIAETAELCRIAEVLGRHPYDLSGGEQQRAALAKLLLLSPSVLLLDEPTKGLDVPFKEVFAEILQKLKNSGVCIVMVSHDIEFCANYADRCGLFFDGGLTAVSKPREFFSGNSFYTTTANRMARGIEDNVVTADELIRVIGGAAAEKKAVTEKAPQYAPTEKIPAKTPLSPWRKLGALISALLAVGLFFYVTKNGTLSEMVASDGVTALGVKQLAFYAVFIVLAIITALFLGGKSAGIADLQTPKEKRRLSKRTVVALVLILSLIPLTLFAGFFWFSQKQYYITALAVLAECMIPFFMVFEGRKPKAREIVVIATLCGMAIAGRAAFFMLPQFKPVMAVTIIAGVAFGGETGFFVGAVSMLVSNMLFSQGPWTPWQMFAMGIIGFLAGVLFKKGVLRRSRGALCVFGVICSFVIYGGITNPASALIWAGESMNLKLLLSYYVTGFPMDAVHACATAVFIWFGAEPLLEKLDRIKTKYGMVE